MPGLGAHMLFTEFENESLIHRKRIKFAVSLLGPFYSICGTDETAIKQDKQQHHAINVITVSPHQEFESDFIYIEQLIQEHFLNYKFVPFEICMMHLKEVQTPFLYGSDCRVYNAIFNNTLRYYSHRFGVSRGERRYGRGKKPG